MSKGAQADYEACENPSLIVPFNDDFDSTTSSESYVVVKKPSFFDSFFLSKFQGGSVHDGILTLLAATIGTGILMIPNSMAASGVIWSVIQMLVCAIISYFSLVIVVKCANDIHVYSYQDLAFKTYGNWCRQLVNFSSFFANWGSAILYLKLTAELFAVVGSIFGGHSIPVWLCIIFTTDPNSRILPVFIATVFVLPLCVAKELKALRYFCLLNIGLVLLFCFVVIYQAFSYQCLTDSFKTVSTFTLSGFTTTFPSAVFAYMSHTNVLDVFRELHAPSVTKMKKIINRTILFVLVTYVIVGIIGYATFSSNLAILSDVNKSNGIILVAYGYTLEGAKKAYPSMVVITMIAMCLSIIISQPFNIKPAKDSLRNFLKPASNASRDKSHESTFQRLLFVISLVTLYSGVLVVLFSDSIQMIMNILGSSFFSLICFIFPSMFYLKIHGPGLSQKDKMVHWLMLFTNGAFAIWNTAQNIMQASK